MRWLLLLAAGCAETAAAGPMPRVIEDAKVSLALPETRPTFAVRAGDTAWIARLPKADTFAQIDGLSGTAHVAITWRQFPQHRRPGFDEEPDYPSLFAGKVDLQLRSGEGVLRTVSLGEASGNVEGGAVTACERRGYRHSTDLYRFRHTDLPNRVAYWEVGTMQGGREYLLLLGTDRIHVLARHVHDGACPTRVPQGPLGDVCEDMRWERAFEVPTRGELRVSEESVEVDEDGRGAVPIDCKASFSGHDLVLPGE